MFICDDGKNEKLVLTRMNMKDRYEHLTVFDRDEPFINAWLKNNYGTNMRVYRKFGLSPDNSCPEDVYNLWEPFACHRHLPRGSQD